MMMRFSVVGYLNSVPSVYEADVHYFGCGSFKISLYRRIRTTGGCSIPLPVVLVFVLRNHCISRVRLLLQFLI